MEAPFNHSKGHELTTVIHQQIPKGQGFPNGLPYQVMAEVPESTTLSTKQAMAQETDFSGSTTQLAIAHSPLNLPFIESTSTALPQVDPTVRIVVSAQSRYIFKPGAASCPSPGCGRTYKCERELRKHKAHVHKNEPGMWPCPYDPCDHVFSSEKHLLAHHDLTHDPAQQTRLPCPHPRCSLKFTTRRGLVGHTKACLYNPAASKRSGSLASEKSRISKESNSLTSTNIGMLFFRRSTSSTGQEKWNCPNPSCGRTYNYRQGLGRHLKTCKYSPRTPKEPMS